jgi:hypothetical protein
VPDADAPGVRLRRQRDRERAAFRSTLRKIEPYLRPEAAIRWETHQVIIEESKRRATRRLPEPDGFEIDHDEGAKWRRFERG